MEFVIGAVVLAAIVVVALWIKSSGKKNDAYGHNRPGGQAH